MHLYLQYANRHYTIELYGRHFPYDSYYFYPKEELP